MSDTWKKCMTRVLAAALLLSFTAGLTPVQYVADGISIGLTAKAENEEREAFACTFADGVLTIKAGTYTNPVIPQQDDDGNDIFQSSVQSIVTDGVVTLKGDCAGLFGNLYSVTSIDLSNVNTAEVTSMASWFDCDYMLSEVKTGAQFKTDNVTNMSRMFYSCYNLRAFDFSGFHTSNVTDMSYMFEDISIEEMDLSGFDTSNVTDMNHMFERASVKVLTLEGWNTEKVENMGNMFCYCDNLEALDLSSFNTARVTDMSYMFNSCGALTSLNVSSFSTGAVLNMYNMFSGCSSLTSLSLSNFDTSRVMSFDSMFSYCTGLTELNVSSFSTVSATSMESMFSGCSSLTALDLSSFSKTDETSTYGIFSECTSLENLTLPDSWSVVENEYLPNTSFQYAGWAKADDIAQEIVSGDGQYAELAEGGAYVHVKTDIVYTYDKSTFTVTLVSGTYSGEDISTIIELCMNGSPDYHYEPNVRKIVVKDGVKFTGDLNHAFSRYNTYGGLELVMGAVDTSEVTNMSYMFEYCIVGDTFDLSSFDTSNVTDMSGMFSSCKTVSESETDDSGFTIVFGDGFDTRKVETMSSMFADAHVASLDLSGFNTSSVTDMSGMFSNCTASSIDLSSFNTSATESMCRMFDGCGAESLNVSGFDTSSVTNMQYMFRNSAIKTIDLSRLVIPDCEEMVAGCENLTSVTFPADFQPKSLDYFFQGCSSLKKFDFSSLDYSQLTSVSHMFADCTALETVTIPEITGITSLDSMFKGCSSLKAADISGLQVDGTTYFDSVFADCTSLKSVTLPQITNSEASFHSFFSGCTALETVNFEAFQSQNCRSLSSMFQNCASLKSIDLSTLSSSYDYFHMEYAFAGCSALESVMMPAFSVSMNSNNESTFRELFTGAERLQSITFNSSVKNSSYAVLESMKLDNANYHYTGWHYVSGDRILSGNEEYAAFSAYANGTYIRDKRTYDKAAVKGASLTLEGQIGLNFICEFPTDADENAYALISGPKGEQKVLLKDVPLDKQNGYQLTYLLAAKQIHEPVSVSIYDGSNTVQTLYRATTDGDYEELNGNTCTYAVADYIQTVQDGTGYSDELVSLVNALEAYGSYAQVYFNYKPDTAAVDTLTAKDAVAAVTADDVSTYKYSIEETLPDSLVFKGYSLVLESETALRLYFESASIEDYFNEERNLRDNMKLVHTSGNTYYVEIGNIPADSLDNGYYFSFPTGETRFVDYGNGEVYSYEVEASFRVSPLSYVYSALAQYGDNEEKAALCNTMRALKLYGDAASAYRYR